MKTRGRFTQMLAGFHGMRLLLAAPAIVIATAVTPSVAVAAETPAEQVPAADAYEQIYEAISGSTDEDKVLDNMIETTKRTLRADPNVAAVEAKYPGYLDAFGATMKPWLRAHSDNVQKQFHPQVIAILKQGLTIKEARIVAAFYRSPLGVRLVKTMTQNFDGANMLGDLQDYQAEGAKIDPSDLNRDVDSAARKTARQLMTGDLTDKTGFLGNRVLLTKMSKISDRLLALRVEMENAPMEKDLEQGMTADIRAKAVEFIKNYGKVS